MRIFAAVLPWLMPLACTGACEDLFTGVQPSSFAKSDQTFRFESVVELFASLQNSQLKHSTLSPKKTDFPMGAEFDFLALRLNEDVARDMKPLGKDGKKIGRILLKAIDQLITDGMIYRRYLELAEDVASFFDESHTGHLAKVPYQSYLSSPF